MEKRCTKCGEIRDISFFHKQTKDGMKRRSVCRICQTKEHREWTHREDIKPKLLAYKRNRYANVPGEKERIAIAGKVYRDNNPEKLRSFELKRRYGISAEEYDDLYKYQNGLCAICGKAEDERKWLSVDHNHKSGNIRGLLCVKCNTGIGALRDDVDVLKKAILYLEEHK